MAAAAAATRSESVPWQPSDRQTSVYGLRNLFDATRRADDDDDDSGNSNGNGNGNGND